MTGLRLFCGVLISVISFYAVFQGIDFSQLKDSLEKIDLGKVLMANVALFACQWFRGQRWARLLRCLGPIGRLKSFEMHSVGNLINLLIPLRGGDVLRAWMMANHLHTSKSAVLATVVTERLSDLVFFGLLLGLSLFLYPLPRWIVATGGLLFLGSVFIVLIILLVKTNYFSFYFLQKIAHIFRISAVAKKFEKTMAAFFSGIVPLSSSKQYVWFVFETFLTWGLQGIFIYVLFDAFNLTQTDHLGWSATLLMLTLTTVAIIVPSSPSYAGTLHLMIVIALTMCGVPETNALSYALVFHALFTIDTLILGVYGWLKMPLKFQRLFSSQASFKN